MKKIKKKRYSEHADVLTDAVNLISKTIGFSFLWQYEKIREISSNGYIFMKNTEDVVAFIQFLKASFTKKKKMKVNSCN